jgi:hypothetical protein
LDSTGLVDITIVKLSPTWRKNIVGDSNMANRFAYFFISEDFLEDNLRI